MSMEINLTIIFSTVILGGVAALFLVYLDEKGKLPPRLRTYLRTVPAIAIVVVVLYVEYKEETLLKFLSLVFFTIAIAVVTERIVNKYKKLTRFGSSLIGFIVGIVVWIWLAASNLLSALEIIINGMVFIAGIVWRSSADEDDKDEKNNNTGRTLTKF